MKELAPQFSQYPVQYSLEALKKQFPSSVRVLKLEGMFLEAEGKFEEAVELYDAALKDHETNCDLAKRKVCVLKAQGKLQEAIAELNKLLQTWVATDHVSLLKFEAICLGTWVIQSRGWSWQISMSKLMSKCMYKPSNVYVLRPPTC